jgi:hypothetical protein
MLVTVAVGTVLLLVIAAVAAVAIMVALWWTERVAHKLHYRYITVHTISDTRKSVYYFSNIKMITVGE